jgi:uncharacterized protein (DUF433 family)
MAALIFPDTRATLQRMNWKDHITIDPEKRGGKPCIRGFRMTVYDVLEYLASGMNEEEILRDFPDSRVKTSEPVLPLPPIGNGNSCRSHRREAALRSEYFPSTHSNITAGIS